MTAIQHLRGATTEWIAAQTTLGNTTPVVAAGEIAFDTTTGTLKIGDGTTLWGSLPYISIPPGGTDGQILARSGTLSSTWIDNYSTSTKHQVKLAEAVNKGQAVYVSSANGTNMIVSKASNNAESTSSKTMGLIETSGTINDFVNVVTEGLLTGTGSSPLDTSSAGSEGDPVWLGTSGNLIYGLANKPVAPAHLVFIGIVTRKHQTQGEIFVRVQNGFEINELHDVLITSPSANQLLTRNSDNSLWVNTTNIDPTIVSGTAATLSSNNILSGSNLIQRNNPAISNTSYVQGNSSLELRTTDGSSPVLGFHRSGYTAVAVYNDINNSLRVRDANTGTDSAILFGTRSEKVPDPQWAASGNSGTAMTATAWGTLVPGTTAITMSFTYDCWVQIDFGGWAATTSADARMGVAITGATSFTPYTTGTGWTSNPSWMPPGATAYAYNGTVNGFKSGGSFVWKVSAGTNNFRLEGWKSSGGTTSQWNYPFMQITPLRWA